MFFFILPASWLLFYQIFIFVNEHTEWWILASYFHRYFWVIHFPCSLSPSLLPLLVPFLFPGASVLLSCYKYPLPSFILPYNFPPPSHGHLYCFIAYTYTHTLIHTQANKLKSMIHIWYKTYNIFSEEPRLFHIIIFPIIISEFFHFT